MAVLHITDPRIHSPFSNRSIDQIGQNAVNRKSAAARLATKISVTFEVKSDFSGACLYTLPVDLLCSLKVPYITVVLPTMPSIPSTFTREM